MEGNSQGDCVGDVAGEHVKTEAADENAPAPVAGSQDAAAPCGGTACGGGGGRGGGDGQAAEELQAAASSAPVLLYSVSAERFFAPGEGKSYLKIAPASAMPPAPSEKTLPPVSDFSSKAVLCLIEAVGRRWGLYETRERSQLFQSVQEEMAAKGHMLPVEKIRRKWNNLIVTYKRVKDRSRETGHAKTSWEFFDLMDATLCDTVGAQIIVNNKRQKGGHAASSPPSRSAKNASKAPLSLTVVRPNGDFTPASVVEPMGLGPGATICPAAAAAAAANSVSTVAVGAPSEVRPAFVIGGVTVATTIAPSTLISSPCFTEAAPSSSSSFSSSTDLIPVSYAELATPRHVSRKTPLFPPGVAAPFRPSSTMNLLNVSSSSSSSSFPSTCLAISVPTPLFATTTTTTKVAGSEGHGRRRGDPQGGASEGLQEAQKRQEEQAHLDRVARRRLEAREKRRERREVRMADSLGRIATALELLSSKQDTVIALLQRLADRK